MLQITAVVCNDDDDDGVDDSEEEAKGERRCSHIRMDKNEGVSEEGRGDQEEQTGGGWRD